MLIEFHFLDTAMQGMVEEQLYLIWTSAFHVQLWHQSSNSQKVIPVYLFGSFPFNEIITYQKKKKNSQKVIELVSFIIITMQKKVPFVLYIKMMIPILASQILIA